MDVRCPRCATDYEFEDTLISERGTTVKCTNCGHQFKVFAQHGQAAPERWLVRTQAGRELVFTSLKALQKAINSSQVTPDDLLSRGQQPPKPLRSIAELEGFFRTKVVEPKPESKRTNTLYGVAPPSPALEAEAASRPAAPRPASKAPATQASAVSDPSVHQQLPAAMLATFEPARSPIQAQAPNQLPRIGSTKPALYSHVESAPTEHAPHTREARTQPYPDAIPNANPEASDTSVFSAAREQIGGERSPFSRTLPEGQAPAAQATPEPIRQVSNALEHMDLDRSSSEISGLHPRATSLRWVVAIVVMGMLTFLALTKGKKYVLPTAEPQAANTDPAQDRMRKLLDQGRALLAQGELESAKEQFDSALGISEKQPEALAARAELEAVRADLEWLKLRLMDPKNEAFRESTQRDFEARLEKAELAVRQAEQFGQDSAIVRAKIDVLRMRGQLASARDQVARLGSDPSKTENAYVLAALDLAEPAPNWESLVQRLRAAALGEGPLGRAQSALVYALGRANQTEAAGAELAKLQGQKSSHPLIAPLKGFLSRAAQVASAPGPTKIPPPAEPNSDAGSVSPTSTAASPSGVNFQENLQQASRALATGDADRADRLYQEVLKGQPTNTEALAGRADVAKRRGDGARAAQLYDQVLAINPSYLPAIIGSADYQWQNGNRAGALRLYRRVVDQAGPTSSYGKRAQAKIDEAANAPPVAPPNASPVAAPTPSPPPTPPSPPAASTSPPPTNLPMPSTIDTGVAP